MKGARFSDLIILCFEKFEIVLRIFILLAGVILLCCQLMLTYGPVRKHLSYVEQIEGQGIEGQRIKVAADSPEITEKSVAAAPETSTAETRLLVITAREPSPRDQAFVTVNGQEVPFVEGEVVLEVREGDLLEINAPADKLRSFRIFSRHNDIEYPVSGTTVEMAGQRVLLGTVRFRR
ncbi:MAG TPA: hypothetical protein DEA44_05880 [Firmicutes bacterium]|nr:hypothetical protein [Bacillota bacterium]